MKTRIRIIRSNPPRRYCTRRKPVWFLIPYWVSDLPGYIATFNRLNNLKE